MQQNQNLTPEQKKVLFEKATEAPFSGAYLHNEKTGVYMCANCGTVVFVSDKKFDSGCGWPSFNAPANSKAVAEKVDTTLGMERTEILCSTCGGHLGHVFADAPDQPTGMRYCVNSLSLAFKEDA